VQAGLDVLAERGGQARVEGPRGDARQQVEPAGAGEVECWGGSVSKLLCMSGEHPIRWDQGTGVWVWVWVWVRTGADGEDEEGNGVEHVAHRGGLREAARVLWMSLQKGGDCVQRGGGLRECVCACAGCDDAEGAAGLVSISYWQQRAEQEQERKEREMGK
jgi:hypothetical protein